MAFRVSRQTLEALEWPLLAERLQEECRTPGARELLTADAITPALDASANSEEHAFTEGSSPCFEQTHAMVRRRLQETSEARRILDDEQFPPLGGAVPLDAICRRAQMGSVLEAQEILHVRAA